MPPPDSAARRIIEFVSWFGDGEIIPEDEPDNPPLYARDLEAAAKAAMAPPKAVLDFINQRTEYVQAVSSGPMGDGDADYNRWQGHMEARRQLATMIGYTTPYKPGEKTAKAES
jgi:hypothetical protein